VTFEAASGMMRMRCIAIRLFLPVVVISAFIFPPISAYSTRELRIENFQSETLVMPDGTIDVTENIQAHFIGGPWHGLYRTIPVEYVTPQGLNYTLFLDVKRVTDASGRTLKYESSRERHYRKLKIYVPDADNSTKTISIEYSVSDALKFFEDHDELYWNVTGDEWDIPIQSASARIILPEGTMNIRANIFTGAYRSRAQNADIEIAGNGVEVRTREPLHLHEGLTVAVAFDKGFVHEPTAASRFAQILRSNWPLGIPIVAFVVMLYLWWTHGRDPHLRPIAAQYEPPNQLTPGEVGTLVDDSADMRDITASIVDLAVRGYLVIKDVPGKHDWELVQAKQDTRDLLPYEETILKGLFDGLKSSVNVSSLKGSFSGTLSIAEGLLYADSARLKWFASNPRNTRLIWAGLGIVVIIVGGVLSLALGVLFALGGTLTITSLSSIPIFIVAHFVPRVHLNIWLLIYICFMGSVRRVWLANVIVHFIVSTVC